MGGGGFGQPGFGGPGFGGPGFMPQNMGSFSYTGGPWGQQHDFDLQQKIEYIFQKYDRNMTGQIDGGEFFMAYQELCQITGRPAPADYWTVQQIAQQSDQNFDGRISRQEMFMLFKRQQFNLW